jgi:hypothetical protein
MGGLHRRPAQHEAAARRFQHGRRTQRHGTVAAAVLDFGGRAHWEGTMVLGIFDLTAYTIAHVIISLVAITAGLVAVFGMVTGQRMAGWTLLFLVTTVLTSVTGFGFPFDHVTPGIIVGAISLVFLAVALFAIYVQNLAGAWRWIYVVSAIVALWFNVFVAIVQAFQKIAFLKALAPTQSEPPFQIVQGVTLVVFIGLTIAAVRKYRPAT